MKTEHYLILLLTIAVTSLFIFDLVQLHIYKSQMQLISFMANESIKDKQIIGDIRKDEIDIWTVLNRMAIDYPPLYKWKNK